MQDTRVDAEAPGSTPEPGAINQDRYTAWSIAIVVLVVVLNIAIQNGVTFSVRHGLALSHSTDPASISSDAFAGLVDIDARTKSAYAESLGGKAFAVDSGKASQLNQVLADAVDLLRSNPDNTSFARRVILLRAELGKAPLAPIPRTRRRAGLSSPLESYVLEGKQSPDFASTLTAESQVWQELFALRVDPARFVAIREALRSLPNMRWYELLAQHQLCLRTGRLRQANREQRQLCYAALESTLGLAGMSVFIGILWLTGLAALLVTVPVAYRRSRASTLPGEPAPLPTGFEQSLVDRFFVPRPPLVNDADRRLRAGDLLNIFAIYLISLQAVSYAIAFGALYYVKPYLSTMSADTRSSVNILITFCGYVGGSLVAWAILAMRARLVGASLADEIGLNIRLLRRQMGFGAVAWGIGLVLMGAMTLITKNLFHAAPAPANPALPLLITAPNYVLRVLLFLMVAAAAPVFEELFFRGALLNALLLRFRPVTAAILTGCIFGLMHPVGIVEASALATLGAVFAWMAYLRKSLAPSMFAHFLQNSTAFFTLYFTFSSMLQR